MRGTAASIATHLLSRIPPGTEHGQRVLALLDDYSRRRKVDRRTFLKSASAFAATLLSLNQVHRTRLFDVTEAEALDDGAAAEAQAKTGGQFIFDSDTHLAYRRGGYPAASPRGRLMLQFFDDMRKGVDHAGRGIQDEDVEGYVTDMWMKSQTDMATLQGFGWPEEFGGVDFIPTAETARARDRAPERTILLGSGYTPNQGVKETLEQIERDVAEHGVQGLKFYCTDGTPMRGWWMDDEEKAYPIWERLGELGIRYVAVHKGIPFVLTLARYMHPEDMDRVVDDFPHINWCVHHAGWPHHGELAALKAFKPHRTNLYCGVGSVFAGLVGTRPVELAHVLGLLCRDVGVDYICWGTDAILWGSPQWQIDAMRRFRIPDELAEGWGYPQLTAEVKKKIFGENQARLWGIDLEQKKRQLSLDWIGRARRALA